MSYQVLLGSPTSELESALSARFEEISDCEVVSAHRNSQEVIDTIAKLSRVEVVLIHEDLGPLPVLDLIREVSRNHPQLAIILVVKVTSPEIFNNAMEAGARGVLAADAPLEELHQRVTNAAEWSRTLRGHLEAASFDVPTSGRRGSILTFSGAKGGVGTTTAALHLTLTAARADQRVCLVDLDLQTGDLPSFLDLSHRRGIIDLVDAGDDISAAMLADTLYVHPAGPHVLLAPTSGERGEDVTASAVRQILGALRSRYDLVIVDCGAVLNEATAMAVELADRAVVAFTPDLAALRGGQRLLSLWERLQVRNKKDCSGLLVRHSRRNEIQPEFARKLLGIAILGTTIPAHYRALEEAANTGNPARVTEEGLRKAFSLLANELGMLSSPDSAASSTSTSADGTSADGAAEFLSAGRKQGGRFRRAAARDRGGVMVEFAATVPLLLLALMLVWQIVLIGLTGMYASHGASEGARQAATTPQDHERITEEVAKRIHSPWDEEDTLDVTRLVDPTEGDRVVAVRVAVDMPVVLPGTSGPWSMTNEAHVVSE